MDSELRFKLENAFHAGVLWLHESEAKQSVTYDFANGYFLGLCEIMLAAGFTADEITRPFGNETNQGG